MAIANVLKPLYFQRLTYVQASKRILYGFEATKKMPLVPGRALAGGYTSESSLRRISVPRKSKRYGSLKIVFAISRLFTLFPARSISLL